MPTSPTSTTATGSTVMTRSARRWVGLSAVVAASVSAVAFVGPHAGAATEDEATVYTPIAPCRLVDTRPEFQIGPRDTKLGADETHRQQVTGAIGNCDVPSDARGVSLNVTAVDQTAPSYMTLFPFGTSVPNVSNLNYVPGGAPIPNKVDVKLSDDGALGVYNLAGTVHLVIDVSGYYSNTWMQDVLDRLAGKADIGDSYLKSETYSQTQIDAALAAKANSSDVYTKSESDARYLGSSPDILVNQATTNLRNFTGSLLSLDLAGVELATITGSVGAAMELIGPAAISDSLTGHTDYRLIELEVCVDDLVTAELDTITISIRDAAGNVADQVIAVDRTTPGCSLVDLSAVAPGEAYLLSLDVIALGGLTGSVDVVSIETTWGPVAL